MAKIVFSVVLSILGASVGVAQTPDKGHNQRPPLSQDKPYPETVRGFMMPEAFSQQDCDDVKAWGANVIRIQLFPARYATSLGKDIWEAWPDFLNRLEGQVKMAEKSGLKVVVDLHQPPFQGVKQFDQAEFWNRNDLEPAFIRVWEDIASKLLPYRSSIWGYDLLNEPLDRSQLPGVTVQWRPLAIKIIEHIRQIDELTWIIFEPGPGSLFSGFKDLEPLEDKRIIYSAHFYYPQDFTHQGVENIQGTDLDEAKKQINLQYPSIIKNVRWDKQRLEMVLKDADDFQQKYNVPIYVGEFSVIRWAPRESANQWLTDVIDLFERRGWSWSYHAFREFHGWSLEHDEQFWVQGHPSPSRVNYTTDRATIIQKAFEKNNTGR